MLSCESWMFMKENPEREKKYFQGREGEEGAEGESGE